MQAHGLINVNFFTLGHKDEGVNRTVAMLSLLPVQSVAISQSIPMVQLTDRIKYLLVRSAMNGSTRLQLVRLGGRVRDHQTVGTASCL